MNHAEKVEVMRDNAR